MVTKDVFIRRVIQQRLAAERATQPDIRHPASSTINPAKETLPALDSYRTVANTVATLPASDLERAPKAQWRGQGDEARNNLDFFTRAIMSDIPSFRDSAINALLRFTREHIECENPYTEYIFDTASWLLQNAHDTGHIGNRAMAGKILTHVEPYLPQAAPGIYETAKLLRIAATEQRNDVTTMITAYRQLIHCLQPAHVEVAEGIATFNGLATMGRSKDIQRIARETRNALTELKSGLPDSGNTSAPSNGGMTGGGAYEGPAGEHALGISGFATAGITFINTARPV